ncbi:MAG: hypothetical protein D4R73_08590 [Deltaproteobacteria bacterium]|nr:MAG: hypothetical protein D4R73_08590 [Deltaproteobacteria bacterium]
MTNFLTDYRIKKILPCIADETKIRAIVEFDDDLGEIMPYLNAVIPRGIYNHIERLLTFMEDGVMITLYPRQAAMAKARDEAHVKELMGRLRNLVNETYENRDAIEPSYEQRQKLKAVDIYKLLPGAIHGRYCRQCGEATCLVFVAKLVSEEVNIARCRLLFTKEFEEKRRILLDILRAAGYCVPPDNMEINTCKEQDQI